MKTLDRARSFALPSGGALTLMKVRSSGACCWFFLSAPNYVQAVGINGTGLQIGTFALTSPITRISSACASAGGQIAVLHWNREIEVYSSAEALAGTFSVGKEASDCVFDGESVFAVIADGFKPMGGVSDRALISGQPLMWPTTTLSVGNHRLGIVELVEATLNVVDTTSGEWHRYQLTAPEIQSIKRPPRMEYTAVGTFFDVTSDSTSGDIYAGVSPTDPAKGVAILKFNQRGDLTARFRCVVPKSPDYITKTNTDGHFTVTRIAVVDDKLLLISAAQKQAVYFDLK